ncbi:MAG: hypothetical protein FP825_09915 [Hyphomonas sp.]|uniref:hypothetical protein n=1 Tax=Hyphomonas sp. TaxID=87 RepID=UPI0017F85C9F|nr:hypothetical protein [Hyphomonas sp.]MBA3068785.1 hypothetical protein [Hyphomonas sp.]MBU3919244.1 hypothetical protein [Alphaproteobacteria bacterium]MBU4062718.1 hypothetical protein [Alphaproteobacteria bacterium]
MTMSSDPFDLLGLDRASATEADVRRAYAERLKTTRPEDDRAGFMALRAAFEQARENVRWRTEYGEDDPYEDYEEEGAGAAEAAPAPAGDSDELTFAPEPEPDDEPGPQDTDEQTFETRIDRAMDRLVDLLTATGFEPDLKHLKACLDDNDVAGIDEFQTLQWRVRQLLCDRTGYNLDPQEIRRPVWLTLEVFDTLDQHFGWTHQPTTNPFLRRLNDWLSRVRTDIAWYAAPQEARKQALLKDMKSADKEERGSMAWLGAAGGIIGYALFQFFTRNAGG